MSRFIFGVSCGQKDLKKEETLKLLRRLGAEWIRTQIAAYPFKNSEKRRITEGFYNFKNMIKKIRQKGFKIMLITFLPKDIPGSFDRPRSNEYFNNCENLCSFIAKQFSSDIQYWQIANEMNLKIFRSPLTIDEAIEFLKACGKGIKKGNSSAKIGVNMADLDKTALYMYKRLYKDGEEIFDYAGIDGYFGSWQPGGPSSWNPALENLYKLISKPIIIQEFGYPSKGSVMTDEERSTGIYPCKLKKWWFKWKEGHTEREQAEYLTAALKIFLSKPYVIGAFYFCWSDREKCWQCGSSDCPVETGWGLVDINGKPKESYYAYQKVISSFKHKDSSITPKKGA